MALKTTTWYIPDMFYPNVTAPGGTYVSHESICFLNTKNEDCELDITFYYEDRDPIQLPIQVCKANRTIHLRLDKVLTKEGEHIPSGVPYAGVVKTAFPIAVQYSRCDTTQAPMSFMSIIPQAVD